MALLTSSQCLCDEHHRPDYSTSSSSSGGRFHIPFIQHFPSDVCILCRDPSVSALSNQLLTIHSTIEEEVGIMCSCMPFFPSIVTNSPSLQKCIHSVQFLGSRTPKLSRHSAATDERRIYIKQASRDEFVEDGVQLHGRELSTENARPESPKETPRMEVGAFEGDERAMSSWTKLQ